MRYRAFLSYSRQDDRSANWLHRALDTYRSPKGMSEGAAGPIPARLHPIFRDRTDMSGGGDLTEKIHQALADSEALIVLCSPAAAASPWVNREVEQFCALGKEHRVFPVIAAGLDDVADVEQSFFPPALRGRGLLAADLREVKLPTGKVVGDGKENGKLKLIAGLLGVGLNDLIQRERRRQRLLNLAFGTAAAGFGLVALFAVYQSVIARNNEARAQAALISAFVERANERMDAGDPTYAMALAIAGWRAAPAYERELQPILSRALFDAPPFSPTEGVPEGFLTAGESGGQVHDENLRAEFSADGRHLLLVQQPLLLVYISEEPPPLEAVLIDAHENWVLRHFQNGVTAAGFFGADSVFVAFSDGRIEVWPRDASAMRVSRQFANGAGVQRVGLDRLLLREMAGDQSVAFRLINLEGLSDGPRFGSECGRATCIAQVRLPIDRITLDRNPNGGGCPHYDYDAQTAAFVGERTQGCSPALFRSVPSIGGLFRRNFDLSTHWLLERSVSISPDGRFEAGMPGGVLAINVRARGASEIVLPQTAPVLRAEFSPNSDGLVVWSDDGFVRHWDLATRRATAEMRAAAAPLGVNAATRIAVVRLGNQLGLTPFASADAARTRSRFEARVGRASDISFSPDGTRVLVLGREGQAEAYALGGAPSLRISLCDPQDTWTRLCSEDRRKPIRAFWRPDGGIITIGEIEPEVLEYGARSRYGAAYWTADGLRQGDIEFYSDAFVLAPDNSHFALTTLVDQSRFVEVYSTAEPRRLGSLALDANVSSASTGFGIDGDTLFVLDDGGGLREASIAALDAGLSAPIRTGRCLQQPYLRQRLPSGRIFCLHTDFLANFDISAIRDGELARKPSVIHWAGPDSLWSRETPESLFAYQEGRTRLSADGRRAMVLRRASTQRLAHMANPTTGLFGASDTRLQSGQAEDAFTHAQIIDFGQDDYAEVEFRSDVRRIAEGLLLAAPSAEGGSSSRRAADPSGAFLFDGARAIIADESGAFIVDSATGAVLATLTREPVDAIALSSNSHLAALAMVSGQISVFDVSGLAPRSMADMVREACNTYVATLGFSASDDYQGRDSELAAGFWPLGMPICGDLEHPHRVPTPPDQRLGNRMGAFFSGWLFPPRTRPAAQ
ncbi:MAG: TIR domain-containing protein [Hyphomonadaceae bacterium]